MATGLPAGRQVYDVLRGVDLIMHADHLHDTVVLDWLYQLAPVMAVSGKGDYGGWQWPDMPRVSGCNV